MVGIVGLLPRVAEPGQGAVHHHHAAAQRDGRTARRARADGGHRGRAGALSPDARARGAVAARHRPRLHRHAGRRRARTGEGGAVAARTGARALPRARVAVGGEVRQLHRRPAPAAGRLLRLDARRLHDGPGAVPRRQRHLQAPLRQGTHLPGRADDQLGPGAPHGAVRPRGGARGGGGRALLHRLSARGRRGAHHRRHHAPGDAAGRHGGRRAPRRRALRASGRQARAAARARAPHPHHRRRGGRAGVRRGRAQGNSGA